MSLQGTAELTLQHVSALGTNLDQERSTETPEYQQVEFIRSQHFVEAGEIWYKDLAAGIARDQPQLYPSIACCSMSTSLNTEPDVSLEYLGCGQTPT